MDEDMVEDMKWPFHADFRVKARERRERSGSEEGVWKEEKEGPVTFNLWVGKKLLFRHQKYSHLLTAGSCTRECWDATGSSIDSSRQQKKPRRAMVWAPSGTYLLITWLSGWTFWFRVEQKRWFHENLRFAWVFLSTSISSMFRSSDSWHVLMLFLLHQRTSGTHS